MTRKIFVMIAMTIGISSGWSNQHITLSTSSKNDIYFPNSTMSKTFLREKFSYYTHDKITHITASNFENLTNQNWKQCWKIFPILETLKFENRPKDASGKSLYSAVYISDNVEQNLDDFLSAPFTNSITSIIISADSNPITNKILNKLEKFPALNTVIFQRPLSCPIKRNLKDIEISTPTTPQISEEQQQKLQLISLKDALQTKRSNFPIPEEVSTKENQSLNTPYFLTPLPQKGESSITVTPEGKNQKTTYISLLEAQKKFGSNRHSSS